MNWKCGCEISETDQRNLGKGSARKRRIADLAKYRCESCAESHLRQEYARLQTADFERWIQKRLEARRQGLMRISC